MGDYFRHNLQTFSDVDFLHDGLHMVYLLSEGARLARLEILALHLALCAHGLPVRLAEPAGAAGLLGLGVDAFHRVMR